MIPARYAPLLFGLIMSGVMSLLVSGISTWRLAGSAALLSAQWPQAWLTAWSVAFPLVLLVAPLSQKLVRALSRPA